MRRVFSSACAFVVLTAGLARGAPAAADTGAIKAYLLDKVRMMDAAAHDFADRASAYQQLIARHGNDYNQAALEEGPALLPLLVKMQDDYRAFHNRGYETIEGITAGTARFVDFDTYLDAGVPKGEATTDNPAAPLVLRTPAGQTLVDRDGNLFHYVIEPTLWGTKTVFLKVLSPQASAAAKGLRYLPRVEVLTAAATDLARKLDDLLAKSEAWQPTLDECVGALVWMTPTLNGYFDDWRDSRYNPSHALGRYVAQSRVLDMRGIMSSLQLTYRAIQPALSAKDPALARQIERGYAAIMEFIARTNAGEQSGKMSILEIEELAYQAKALTDQLGPELKQAVALLGVNLPRKPTLI
ncbi:MAG TPA: imelysin family protein [Chthoniobacterales bacterium]